jgi:hypothetical protein
LPSQPGPDVEELPYPAFGREESHGPCQERPVGPHVRDDPRVGLDRPFSRLTVRREVVLPAQPVVVDARRMRVRDVKLRDGRLAFFGNAQILTPSRTYPF